VISRDSAGRRRSGHFANTRCTSPQLAVQLRRTANVIHKSFLQAIIDKQTKLIKSLTYINNNNIREPVCYTSIIGGDYYSYTFTPACIEPSMYNYYYSTGAYPVYVSPIFVYIITNSSSCILTSGHGLGSTLPALFRVRTYVHILSID